MKDYIADITRRFVTAYPDAYRQALAEAKETTEAFHTLNVEQRNHMEAELLDKLVPTDQEVLVDIIIAHPVLFTEQIPAQGLFDVSPAQLVRYNLMTRAKLAVPSIIQTIEAEAFSWLDRDGLRQAFAEVLETVKRSVRGASSKGEVIAAGAALQDFARSPDDYSFNNLISDGAALVSMLHAAAMPLKARQLEEILQFAETNKRQLLA